MNTKKQPYRVEKQYNGDTWVSFDYGYNSRIRIFKRPGLDDGFLIASKFEGNWMFIDPTMLSHDLYENMYWFDNILFSNKTIFSQQVKFTFSLKKNNGELLKITNNTIKRFAKGQSLYGKIVVNIWLYKILWGKTSEEYRFNSFDFVRNFNSPLVYDNIDNNCLSLLTNKHICSKFKETDEHYTYYHHKRQFISKQMNKLQMLTSDYFLPYLNLKKSLQNIPIQVNKIKTYVDNLKYEQDSCPICFKGYCDEDCQGLVLYPCYHAICVTCDFELRTNSHSWSNYKCPQCRVEFNAYTDSKRFLNPDFNCV